MECGFHVQLSMRNAKHYTGVTRKYGITVDGVNYIVKFAKEGLASAIYSEYVASNFITALGVSCQKVWWGYADGQMVNIIQDFKRPGEELHSFQDVDQADLDTHNKTENAYTYENVLDLLQRNGKADGEATIKQFWEQFICDAILGNRDRHAGNWGFLTDPQGECRPAPIYDNGGSLFPEIGGRIHEFRTHPFEFLAERSEKLPVSLFRVVTEDGLVCRTNYYDILGVLPMPEFAKSLSLERVSAAARQATLTLPQEPYARFYHQVICMRYLHIIERMGLEDAYSRISHITD